LKKVDLCIPEGHFLLNHNFVYFYICFDHAVNIPLNRLVEVKD